MSCAAAQGKYHEPGGAPPEARLNRYRGRYAEAESRWGKERAVRTRGRYAGAESRWEDMAAGVKGLA